MIDMKDMTEFERAALTILAEIAASLRSIDAIASQNEKARKAAVAANELIQKIRSNPFPLK